MSLPVLVVLVALGGIGRDHVHAVAYQFTRGSLAVRLGRAHRRQSSRSPRGPCSGCRGRRGEAPARAHLAGDRGRMAALSAAILIGLQLTADYWAFLYVAWVVPLAGVSLLADYAWRSPPSGFTRVRPFARSRSVDGGMSSKVRTKLDGFDGLRALAALTVLTYHVELSRGFSPAGSWPRSCGS